MQVMTLTPKESEALTKCLDTLHDGTPVCPRLEEFTPTMNIYHLPMFTVHVRRCPEASWTWVEAFNNGPGGKTVYSVKVTE